MNACHVCTAPAVNADAANPRDAEFIVMSDYGGGFE